LLAWLCAAQAFRVPFSTATAAVARRAARGVASVARAVSMRHRGSCACASCVSSRRQRAALCMAADGSAVFPDPTPGNPVLKHVDKERNVAFMRVALSGAQTQSAFAKSCDLFNDEVKNRDYKVAGFRKGAKLPPAYLYQMFGEDKVKLLCGNLLSEEIQDECEKIGLMFVGRGRITNFYEDQFVAGKPHVLEIECDLWPEIDYGAKGYKGLTVTVNTSPIDMEKYAQVKDVRYFLLPAHAPLLLLQTICVSPCHV
jgi:Bacterial trigger factor protein (TF)